MSEVDAKEAAEEGKAMNDSLIAREEAKIFRIGLEGEAVEAGGLVAVEEVSIGTLGRDHASKVVAEVSTEATTRKGTTKREMAKVTTLTP